jgi:hypothetical protein
MERRLWVSSPLQIVVLVLLGAALWGIFYIINVLPGKQRNQGPSEGAREELHPRVENDP